ncbi:MAG: hypothetical protein OXC63_02900 [Aestuariivita sp.]|nr:hypothetical protein [Aestuariivita sp.]MCY4347132.1 hypothetical protein [Aestuariivita sp.]
MFGFCYVLFLFREIKEILERLLLLVGALLWLPLSLVAVGVYTHGSRVILPSVEYETNWNDLFVMLLPVAPAGLFLALPVYLMFAVKRPQIASLTALVIGLLTVFVTMVMGLLGPIAMILAAAILSTPAWYFAHVMRKFAKREQDNN